MALLSKSITPVATLDRFLAWCVANGYHVGENPRYGTKRVTGGVHAKTSFHYAGLAADINYGSNGAQERAKLLVAMAKAQSMGLAVTFAKTGTVGTAANHRNHLHVDTGEWSNIGAGAVRARTIPLVSGAKFDPVLKAVQERLNRDYPAYSDLVADGINGPATRAVVTEFQSRAGLVADGIAGPLTRKKLGL